MIMECTTRMQNYPAGFCVETFISMEISTSVWVQLRLLGISGENSAWQTFSLKSPKPWSSCISWRTNTSLRSWWRQLLPMWVLHWHRWIHWKLSSIAANIPHVSVVRNPLGILRAINLQCVRGWALPRQDFQRCLWPDRTKARAWSECKSMQRVRWEMDFQPWRLDNCCGVRKISFKNPAKTYPVKFQFSSRIVHAFCDLFDLLRSLLTL